MVIGTELKKNKTMLKKSFPKKNQPIQSGTKSAYDLVAKDLFSTLKKAKDGAVINKFNAMNNHYQPEQQNNQEQVQTKPEPSGLIKMVGQSLPFLPLLFEQFTGQKIPQMGGTIFEIQMALNQVIASQQ
ncbi:720_t:CDS:2, partial [Ambispora leptoticha]